MELRLLAKIYDQPGAPRCTRGARKVGHAEPASSIAAVELAALGVSASGAFRSSCSNARSLIGRARTLINVSRPQRA